MRRESQWPGEEWAWWAPSVSTEFAGPHKCQQATLHHVLRPTHPLGAESPDAHLFPSRETEACTFEEEVGLG